jgi:hypothetical protein
LKDIVMPVEKRVKVRIRGITSLLYHRYVGEGAGGRQGDKNPRKQAEIHLHTFKDPVKGDLVYIPGRAIFAALVNAGIFQKLGKKSMTTGKTSLVPAFTAVAEDACVLYGNDNKPVTPSHGWEVDTAPVVNPSTGGRIICHRPRVEAGWYCDFTLILSESETYGEDMARKLVDDAGTKVGLLAFRPQKKGPHGKFAVVRWDVELVEEADAA